MQTSEIKKIGFVGFGRSNSGVFEYLKRSGSFHFTLRSRDAVSKTDGIHKYKLGDGYLSDIDEDILFISPAVRRSLPELSRAAERGVILSSDAELFFSQAEAQVYAVTGSSGKSTVTALISSMLSECGIYAPPAGNFGCALTSYLGKCKAVAAELSSFQLMYMKPRTKRAVITNITPNHLDWHTDMDEYVGAKLNIADNTGGLILDFDSDICCERAGKAPFALVSTRYNCGQLCRIARAENYITLDTDMLYLNGEPHISIKGAPRCEGHNVKNFMLASAAMLGICEPECCRKAIMKFTGLAHRAQLICEYGGVKFINSSIDTSAERTIKTLESLFGHTVVVISGKNKGLPLERLAEELSRLTVGAVLMGDIGRELAPLLCNGYRYVFADDFNCAVSSACALLDGEGNVILSPAGTSFDKFKNYEKRGDAFCRAVKEYIKTVKDI